MTTDVQLEEAVRRLAAALPEPKLERVPLIEAFHRVLAEDLSSLCDHPNLDDSALDGYAVRLEDTERATPDHPVRLEVIAEVAAGGEHFTGTLEAGQAVKVFTGAPVPPGTTGIVMVEHTARDDAFVIVRKPATPDVRRKGQDLETGRVYLKRGTILRGAQIALAAAMGHAELPVLERPRVGILSTGDEVVEPGQDLPEGAVYNSGSYGLAALLEEMGAETTILSRVADDPVALEAAIRGATEMHLLLTIGGVSMGERDFVRMLLERDGCVDFWRIRVKPGGPPILGTVYDKTLFGLPGNPVSSLVIFRLVVKAALYERWGVLEPAYETVRATAATPFKSAGQKLGLWRARLEYTDGAWRVSGFSNQSSQVLRSLVESNALAVVQPGHEIWEGETLEVIRL
jgi:molybdopterin molybdotransferase